MKNYLTLINEALESVCATWHGGAQNDIYAAMEYYLLAPGKRIRPCLTLAFAEEFGVSIMETLPFACALEMIHAYSLIHDDLPCMDDDDLRRGRPTCHKVFGEAMAVLAGDALLNKAFETMLAAPAERRAEAALAVGKLSGTSGMIGGQVIDIKGISDPDSILKMYELKTSALLECSAEIAIALSGTADNEKIVAARDYCKYLGLAFQIKDDLLDVYGDTNILGKSTGSDEKDGKNTVLAVLGKEKTEELVKKYTDIAVSSCERFTENKEYFMDFANKMLTRNK